MFGEIGLKRGVVFQEGGGLSVVKGVGARKKRRSGLSREGFFTEGDNCILLLCFSATYTC